MSTTTTQTIHERVQSVHNSIISLLRMKGGTVDTTEMNFYDMDRSYPITVASTLNGEYVWYSVSWKYGYIRVTVDGDGNRQCKNMTYNESKGRLDLQKIADGIWDNTHRMIRDRQTREERNEAEAKERMALGIFQKEFGLSYRNKIERFSKEYDTFSVKLTNLTGDQLRELLDFARTLKMI